LLVLSVDQANNKIYLVRSLQSSGVFIERIERFDPVQKSFTVLNPPVLPTRSVPFALAHSPQNRLYLANLGNTPSGNVPSNVTIVDLGADDVAVVPVASGPWTVAVDAQRNLAFVPTTAGLEVIAVNPQGDSPYRVMLRQKLGPDARTVAVHSVSGEIYVGDIKDGSVHAIPAMNSGQMVAWQ
jgi:DNA-binding beta-propeller fold protein YncE